MFWLTIIFGLCTVAGFTLSILQLVSHRKGTAVERAKTASQLQRIEHTKFTAALIHDTVDLAIQRAKKADHIDLTDLLRVARGSLEVLMRELEDERIQLKSWQFGRLFDSIAVRSADPEQRDEKKSEQQAVEAKEQTPS